MDENDKRTLLEEIETLMAYGRREPTMDPALLKYLDRESLEAIRDRLKKKHATLSDEDKEWLARFRREEPSN
jgi:hypothetical protein